MQPTRTAQNQQNLNYTGTDFHGDLVAKTSPSNAGGMGLISGRGAKIPHVSWPKIPKHKKIIYIYQQYCNKLNKTFKNGSHQKKKSLKVNKLYR